MGIPLFGVDVSGIVRDVIGPGVPACTLIKVTIGSRTLGEPTAGTNPTEVSYSGRGFVDYQRKRWLDGTLLADGHLVALLFGDTFGAAPALGDKVTLESVTYRIEKLDRDPAAATYTVEIRLA